MWFRHDQRVCCGPYQHQIDEGRRSTQFALAYPGTGQLALNRDFINNGKGLQPPNRRQSLCESGVRLVARQAHQAQGNASFSR